MSVTENSPAIIEASTHEGRIDELLHEVGLDPTVIAPRIKDRLVLLEELTPTVDDERAAINMARSVFQTAEAFSHSYTDEEQRTVIIGTLFTDIGKSGPREANEEQSRLIATMFSVENLPPEEVQAPIADFLHRYFGEDAERAKDELTALGLDVTTMTMRDLYNSHTKWTLEILLGDGVPKEAIPAAAAHHHMRGDNPDAILNSQDIYTGEFDFGNNSSYDRPEKLVSILDMYDAYRRRGQLDHASAMEQLRAWTNAASEGKYAHDPEVVEILEDINTSLMVPA